MTEPEHRSFPEKSIAGFTLLELLVVIAIIGILSTAILAIVTQQRAKARDARRQSDLAQIRTGLELYNEDYGHYMANGSGCGFQGNGDAYWSYSTGPLFPKSMAQCLVDEGYVPNIISDPLVPDQYYMKYTCDEGTYLYAALETGPDPESTIPSNACGRSTAVGDGMNYYIKLE